MFSWACSELFFSKKDTINTVTPHLTNTYKPTCLACQTKQGWSKNCLKKTANNCLKPPSIKLDQNAGCAAEILMGNGVSNCHVPVLCHLWVPTPMCTCCWWGSLWISLMAFRVLIAGFCMELGNESLDVISVPNESAHCFSETHGRVKLAGSSWNSSLFIHLYIFVCGMNYLCNCHNTHTHIYTLVVLVRAICYVPYFRESPCIWVCVVFKCKQKLFALCNN